MRDSGIQDTDERSLKKRRLSSRNKKDDKRQIQREIKESVQRIEAEVQETNVILKDLLHEIQSQQEE